MIASETKRLVVLLLLAAALAVWAGLEPQRLADLAAWRDGHPVLAVLAARVLASLAGATAVCVVTGVVVFSTRVERGIQGLLRFVTWPEARLLLSRLLEAMQAYAERRPDLLNVLAGSVGVQVLRIIQAYFLGLSLGMSQPLSLYLAYIPLILLVMLLPVTVNGLGTSQAAFVWCFAQASVPRATSFTLSVLFVALGIVGNLPGGLLYVTGGLSAGGRRSTSR
jgi:hypothetical protein